MKIYKLTINGNQENPDGNPIGYTRVLSHSMRADGARYLEWLQFVRAKFFDETGMRNVVEGKFGTPIHILWSQNAHVEIKVYWKNLTHADLDNVLKGILDALFFNDKEVNSIKASCEMSPDRQGKVDILVRLSTPKLDPESPG